MKQKNKGVVWLIKQQRLPAWQLALLPQYVAVFFFILAFIFTILGVVFLLTDNNASDISVRYDHINHCTYTKNTGAFAFEGNNIKVKTGCITEVSFNISKTLTAPVYLYYDLTKFYQNHRRYLVSRSDAQLMGKTVRKIPDASPFVTPGEVSGTTETPIIYDGGVHLRYKDFVYVPAGLIAWSMFNDTFTLYLNTDDANGRKKRTLICNATDFSKKTNLPLGGSVSENMCTKKGIAWSTDVSHKFKAPSMDRGKHFWTAARELYINETLTSPLSNDSFLNNGWYAGELGHSLPVTTDEDLMVWMRPASLPSFRKLHRVIHTDLAPGNYIMVINEHYDVISFGGTKSFSLVKLSWLGGKNHYLAVMYLVIGGLCFVFFIFLLLVRFFFGENSVRSLDKLILK